MIGKQFLEETGTLWSWDASVAMWIWKLGPDGPEMGTRWSWNGLFPMGEHICYCKGIFLGWIWTSGGSSGLLAWFLAWLTWSWSCRQLVRGIGMSVLSLLFVILSVCMINLPQLLQGLSHLCHLSHLLLTGYHLWMFHVLYCTQCCWERVWTGYCRF